MKKNKILIVAVFFSVFLLSGNILAFWPVAQGNFQKNGRSSDAGPEGKGEKWHFKKNIETESSVAVASDGAIYVIGREGDTGILYAVNQQGKEIWQHQYAHGYISHPVLGYDRRVYLLLAAGSQEAAYLIALDSATGKETWKVTASRRREDDWYPRIAISKKGRIYVATEQALLAFTLDGVLEWTYNFPVKRTVNTACANNPSLSPDESAIYLYRGCGGGLYAFNLNGAAQWHDKSEYTSTFLPAVAGSEGVIYIADESASSIHAIAPDGKKKWKAGLTDMPQNQLIMALAIGSDGTVYTVAQDAKNQRDCAVFAIRPGDGKIKWRFAVKNGSVSTALAVDKNNTIYYGSADGNIYALNSEGRLLWKYFIAKGILPTDKMTGYPAISRGIFYIITSDGVLHAIGK